MSTKIFLSGLELTTDKRKEISNGKVERHPVILIGEALTLLQQMIGDKEIAVGSISLKRVIN